MKVKGLKYEDAILLAYSKIEQYLETEQIGYIRGMFHSCIRMNIPDTDITHTDGVLDILKEVFGKKYRDYCKLNSFDGDLYIQWKQTC